METNPSRNSRLRLIQPMSNREQALSLLPCPHGYIGRKDRPCLKKLALRLPRLPPPLDKDRQSLSDRSAAQGVEGPAVAFAFEFRSINTTGAN